MLWRSRRLPDYRKRWGERLGFYPAHLKLKDSIWIHAVSVGETIAATPLIRALQARYPASPFIITTMTPTGAARVKASFGDTVQHAYLPYDLPGAVRRFLNTVQPRMGIIVETELWPTLLTAAHARQIPLCLLNARLSSQSARGYRCIAPLMRNVLRRFTFIAAHGQADAERFLELGAIPDQITVTGNIKFDLTLPEDLLVKSEMLRKQWGDNRFIWVAASTHEGEEEIVLAAHHEIRKRYPQALLLLVPRHPDRFEKIAKLCEQQFYTVRRSSGGTPNLDTAVFLGDTMGELLLFYGVADVAFVAGSLIPQGGHNVLEAAALHKPILTGPHVFNFTEINALLSAANALLQVHDAAALAEQLMLLIENEQWRTQLGLRAAEVMAANRGALAKQLTLVTQVLDAS